MKKFFAIAFVAASLVACNSGGEKKEGGDTTAPAPADTTAPAPAPADTTAKPADTTAAAPAADTTKK